MQGYTVTHFSRRACVSGQWIELPFITKVEGVDRPFRYGIDESCSFSQEDIDRLVDAGTVGVLQNPHILERGQMLWLTPEGHIYLASISNPTEDGCKVLVGDQ